jgi:hypothetical protein
MPRTVLYATPEEKRRAAAERAKRWRERNPEAAKAAKQRFAEKNPSYYSEQSKAYAARNPEKIRAANAKWRAENVEQLRVSARARYDANPEPHLARLRDWRLSNPNRVAASQRKRSANFKALNRHVYTAHESRRRAAKLQATPPWADEGAIRQFYLISNFLTCELGVSFTVDHVVPLRSELVCGLHAHTNLSIALGVLNSAKSNKFWPDMPATKSEKP